MGEKERGVVVVKKCEEYNHFSNMAKYNGQEMQVCFLSPVINPQEANGIAWGNLLGDPLIVDGVISQFSHRRRLSAAGEGSAKNLRGLIGDCILLFGNPAGMLWKDC